MSAQSQSDALVEAMQEAARDNPEAYAFTNRQIAEALAIIEAGVLERAAGDTAEWLRELASSSKATAQEWFDRNCESEGDEWRVRGETFAFIADQIEHGDSPIRSLKGGNG